MGAVQSLLSAAEIEEVLREASMMRCLAGQRNIVQVPFIKQARCISSVAGPYAALSSE